MLFRKNSFTKRKGNLPKTEHGMYFLTYVNKKYQNIVTIFVNTIVQIFCNIPVSRNIKIIFTRLELYELFIKRYL